MLNNDIIVLSQCCAAIMCGVLSTVQTNNAFGERKRKGARDEIIKNNKNALARLAFFYTLYGCMRVCVLLIFY